MRAYIIDKDSPLTDLPSKLVQDAPKPECHESQLLIDVHSASLNLFDGLQVQGKYQIKVSLQQIEGNLAKEQDPFVLGTEIAGVISRDSPIPEDCNWIPGKTRVFGAGEGSYADQVTANPWQLKEVPEGMSLEEASGLYITWPTSYAALKYRGRLQPDEWCLVHAGAGGVGLAAIQLAKAMGAKVIATAGSEEKMEICKKVGGADFAINYRNPKWFDEVKKITDGHGADVVYDPVGMLIPSLKCIAWNGRLVVIGFAAGSIEKIPANLLLLKSCEVVGCFWGMMSVKEPEVDQEVWSTLLKWFAEKKITATTFDPIYDGLDQMPRALDDLLARKTWGKVCVRVKADPEHPPTSSSKL